MSQQSEELASDSPSANGEGQGARILRLKSTPYDLQRAIQQRAQESVEREAQLDSEERRPKPVKWLIAFAIACVPIALTLFAVDGFLRVFHKYLDTVSKQEQQQALPPEGDLQATPSEPGVVMLQPLNPPQAASETAKSPAPDSSTPNR